MREVHPDSGIVSCQSRHSVEQTVLRLDEAFRAKGVKLFAVIDHSGEAESAGIRMPNTKLVIFGSPKAGTPVMLAAPNAALDLPLRILVSEDNQGEVWLRWNSPDYLRARHGFPPEMVPNIAAAESFATAAAK